VSYSNFKEKEEGGEEKYKENKTNFEDA